MRKILLGLCLIFTAGLALGADASSFVVIGPGAAVGGPTGTADGTYGPINVSKNSYQRVQATCASAPCTGVITVLTAAKANPAATSTGTPVAMPFVPLISCTNPTSQGICTDGSIAYWNIPITMQLEVVQSGTGGGTFEVVLETHILSSQ